MYKKLKDDPEALEKLKILSDFDLHSIEQPIRQGQFEEMARLCEVTPLPIALDEELIPACSDPGSLLNMINPQYIILKPSLLGGFDSSQRWISAAESIGADYWITSALESNVGLNAIAQWTYTLTSPLAQGLGTGGLFTNNIQGTLEVERGKLWNRPDKNW